MIAECKMTDDVFLNRLREIAKRFCESAAREFALRMTEWRCDFSQNEVREVVGGLVARQVTLAREVVGNSSIWNGHVAPMLLRSMADVHINVAWILREPVTRAKMFVAHGLGQAKLQLEHQKAISEESGKRNSELIEGLESWVNEQRLLDLTNVELGSWSELNARKMAEEAGCLEFYNFVYTPFSTCTHSTWPHISVYNLSQCKNVLHGFHSVPAIKEVALDPHYPFLAGKYMQKTFATFDSWLGISIRKPSAFSILDTTLTQLFSDQSDSADSTT